MFKPPQYSIKTSVSPVRRQNNTAGAPTHPSRGHTVTFSQVNLKCSVSTLNVMPAGLDNSKGKKGFRDLMSDITYWPETTYPRAVRKQQRINWKSSYLWYFVFSFTQTYVFTILTDTCSAKRFKIIELYQIKRSHFKLNKPYTRCSQWNDLCSCPVIG
jgi:hypothetical protein